MRMQDCLCGVENYICPVHEPDKYCAGDREPKRRSNDPDLHETFGLMRRTFKGTQDR